MQTRHKKPTNKNTMRYYPSTTQLTVELPPLAAKAEELEAKLAGVKADKAELKTVRESIRAILHGPKQIRKPRETKAKAKTAKAAKAGTAREQDDRAQ